MRIAGIAAASLFLGGCSDLYEMLYSPSDEETARQCGVTEAELKAAKQRVKELEPYQGRDIGRCSLILDDTGIVMVAVKKPGQGSRP